MKYLAAFCLMAFLASPPGAQAAFTEKDTLAIGRLIGLLQNMPKDEVNVAVVTQGAASQSDATNFLLQIGSGRRIGNLTITASIATPEQVATIPARVLLLPAGLDTAALDTVFAAARQRKLVTISNSTRCLEAKRCAIAIRTDPAVDIQMSASAAAQTGVSFGANFHMMIKEMP
jgi:hypothetical protein